MTAIHRLAVCVLFALVPAALADEKADKEAFKSIEGKYKIIGLEKEKQKITEDDLKKVPKPEILNVEIKDGMIIANFSGKPDEATLKIDASKSPMWVDITSKKEKPEVDYGIFKIEKDVLTICTAEKGKEADRPKEFKATGNVMIMTLRKQK